MQVPKTQITEKEEKNEIRALPIIGERCAVAKINPRHCLQVGERCAWSEDNPGTD